ncbi:helix-turn-helix transcriptional regulator [Methanobacterium sp.]|uniref:PadR family transcriptional regulator n=1 Tax=Methanobacterium sp. TaxID=2164 RepID=UPI0031595807
MSDFKEIHDKLEELGKLGGLRIWIIHVLDRGPKNGVEIMDAIQEHHEQFHQMADMRRNIRDDPEYYKRMDKNDKHYYKHLNRTMKHASRRPSPGSVYPMLKKMVSEGFIVKQEDGRYELTDLGRETYTNIFGPSPRSHEEIDRSAQAVENALTEIESYVSYLNDIKKEKLVPHKEWIGTLSEKLKKMKDSLKEE